MSESIEQIEDELTLVALKFGVSRSVAGDLSRALLERVKSGFGGGCLYIPKPDKKQRNKEIRQKFNGTNADELAKVFGISKRQLYRIIEQKP